MTPVGANAMRRLDKLAGESGISALTLMEKAGEAVAKKTEAIVGLGGKKAVTVLCGKGNNGGDGFVAARRLSQNGFEVHAYLFGSRRNIKKDADRNLQSFIDLGGKVEEVSSAADIGRMHSGALIIDAILGTGFTGSLSGILLRLVESLNTNAAPILSVDVPSGLNATTGEADPTAIKARWTVTFALPKKGFYLKSGPLHTGEIEVVNIGFPDELIKRIIEAETGDG